MHSRLQSKSWNWLHLILLFHFLLGSLPYSFLIERCNPCCPLSPIWFITTDMINVLLNLLPIPLITVLKESGPATKCHSSKCHGSLFLFSLCLFRTRGDIPTQVNFARQIWRDQKMWGGTLLPVLVLGVVKVCKQKIYISLLQNCNPELLLQGKSHPKYSPYACTDAGFLKS